MRSLALVQRGTCAVVLMKFLKKCVEDIIKKCKIERVKGRRRTLRTVPVDFRAERLVISLGLHNLLSGSGQRQFSG